MVPRPLMSPGDSTSHGMGQEKNGGEDGDDGHERDDDSYTGGDAEAARGWYFGGTGNE